MSVLLNVEDADLLAFANNDRLAAYRLRCRLHVRYRDVASFTSRRAIAA